MSESVIALPIVEVSCSQNSFSGRGRCWNKIFPACMACHKHSHSAVQRWRTVLSKLMCLSHSQKTFPIRSIYPFSEPLLLRGCRAEVCSSRYRVRAGEHSLTSTVSSQCCDTSANTLFGWCNIDAQLTTKKALVKAALQSKKHPFTHRLYLK